MAAAFGGANGTQGGFVNTGTVLEFVQGGDIDTNIGCCVLVVVESAFGNTADEGHLATLETWADGRTRTGALAFATATAGLAVAAGFTLAEALTTMLGTWAGLQIMETHK